MPTRDWNMRKSSMQTYKYCQRYFYYAIICERPRPVTPYLAQMGTNFHAYSAEFYDVVRINKEPTYTYYRECLPSNTHIDEWYDKFAQFEVNRMRHILNEGMEPRLYFLPIAKELRIVLDDHLMEGTIDRVWRLDNDQPCVQDVKPSLSKYKSSLRRELCFYIYLCNEYEPLAEEWGPFEWISGYGYKKAEVWVEKLKKRTMSAMLTLLDVIDYDISKRLFKEEWIRNTWAFCTDCPFNKDCWLDEGEPIPMPDLAKGREKRETGWTKSGGE